MLYGALKNNTFIPLTFRLTLFYFFLNGKFLSSNTYLHRNRLHQWIWYDTNIYVGEFWSYIARMEWMLKLMEIPKKFLVSIGDWTGVWLALKTFLVILRSTCIWFLYFVPQCIAVYLKYIETKYRNQILVRKMLPLSEILCDKLL